jgi:predicted nucleic acid-binding protein
LLVAAHALAETYATLTAMRPRLTPTGVLDLMQQGALRFARVVALDGDDYLAVLSRLARIGLTSDAVYDALHVRAAEKAGADELVTLNGRDFRRMPPASPCRLVVL